MKGSRRPHSKTKIGNQRLSEVETIESLLLQQESLARESRSKSGSTEWSKTESGIDSKGASIAVTSDPRTRKIKKSVKLSLSLSLLM